MRILVGSDFSPASIRAAEVALAWARRTGSALRVIHVVPPRRWLTGLWQRDLAPVSAIHHEARAALKRLAETLDSSRTIELSTGLVSGAASGEIARAAVEFKADLLIIGARGEHETRRSPSGLGATSVKLLGTAAIPLLLVRTAGAESPRSVLAAVDLSPVSKEVLRWALVSTGNGRGVWAFHAYEAPFARRLEAYGIAKESIDLYGDAEQRKREHELDTMIEQTADSRELRRIVERGDPLDLLFGHVQQLNPDLIVLGRHGSRSRRRSGQGAGSVSWSVAFSAPTNLMVVPPFPPRRQRPVHLISVL